MIKESVQEWNENPVITSVDSIESPLSDIDFPTVTLCHEPQYQVDNWALTEMIFNFFEFGCGSSDFECKGSEALRKDFQPFLDIVFDYVTKKIKDTLLDEKALQRIIRDRNVDDVVQSILANLTSIEELEEVMKTSIGKFSSEVTFVKKFVPKSGEVYACENNCQELNRNSRMLLFKAKVFKLTSYFGFGTLLRNFASMLGITFDQKNTFTASKRKIQLCNELSCTERRFHGIMFHYGGNFGVNASLHDFPTFQKVVGDVKEEGELRLEYPFYTLCQYDTNNAVIETINGKKYLPTCFSKWWNTLKSSNIPEENPYVKYNNTFCSKGTSLIIGSNLTRIMNVMKFAHHFQSMRDYRYFYNLLQVLELPYTLRPLEEVINEKFFKYENVRPFVLDYLGMSPTFQPVITNTGICQAWNHQNQDEVFKGSSFLNAFESVFTEIKPSDRNILPASIKSKVIYFDKQETYLFDRHKEDFSFW